MASLLTSLKSALGALACTLRLHDWAYPPNEPQPGGRPCLRNCRSCGKVQMWNYDQARIHGRIVWIDRPGA